MCFSPEADLATGLVVSVVGVDALRHVSRRQQLLLASTPLLFGAHQIDESLVWWGLRGQLPWPVTHAAIYIFLAVAFALPFLVPLAIVGIEPVTRRRELMLAFLAAGTLATVGLLIAVVSGPVGATIDGSHIAYSAQIDYAYILGAVYVASTCGSLLVASSRLLVSLGLINLGAVITLSWLTFTGLTSLWCAFAAVTSVTVAIYLRRVRRSAEPSTDALAPS